MKDESMGGDGDEGFEEIRRIIVEITVESLSDYCPITGRITMGITRTKQCAYI